MGVEIEGAVKSYKTITIREVSNGFVLQVLTAYFNENEQNIHNNANDSIATDAAAVADAVKAALA